MPKFTNKNIHICVLNPTLSISYTFLLNLTHTRKLNGTQFRSEKVAAFRQTAIVILLLMVSVIVVKPKGKEHGSGLI